MAVVQVKFRENAARVITYVFKDKKPDDPADAELCSPERDAAISEFKGVRDAHNFKGGWQCLHVVQSFSPSDSKKLTPEKANELGRNMVAEYWKGHQFLVVTHTNTDKLHNHIVVGILNVHTGRRIPNKTGHWKELVKRSDALCVEAGLSVLDPVSKGRKPKLPEGARRMMEERGAHSYVYDMMRKANLARSVSTSYDEYRSHLNILQVGVRIEEKNITYFYPGKEKGKRGDKLGEKFHKPFLEESFKANDEKFRKNPELRARLLGQLEEGAKFEPLRSASKTRSYSEYTPMRRGEDPFNCSELKVASSILPFWELKRAREGNILEYCKRNKIELEAGEGGWHSLKGRSHVLVSDGACKNTRNGSQGTLIDFVAAHHQITMIQAVARINNNPNLVLLESSIGIPKDTFHPFFVPQGDRLDGPKAASRVAKVLKAFGSDSGAAEALIRNKRAQVSKGGTVRIFAKDDPGGAFEFQEHEDGKFSKTKKGEFTKPFYSLKGSGRRAVVFLDPFSVLNAKGKGLFQAHQRSHGILALMEPKESLVDQFVAQNPHVMEISLVKPAGRAMTQVEIDLFGNLKRKYHAHQISVEASTVDQAFRKEGPRLSR